MGKQMNKDLARRLVVLMIVALVAAACGSDSESEAGETTTTTSVDSGDASTDTTVATAADPGGDGPIDLTDQVLTSTDGNCASYAGSYTSMITDFASGQDFEGMFTISVSDGTCGFQTNQIPNHDTGIDAGFVQTMAAVDANLSITATPELAASTSALGMGANVIMLNGVKWEAYPAACFGVGNEPIGREAIGCFDQELDNPWRYNIGSPLNDFGFDTYLAHLQPGGLYHYHSTPSVLYAIDCEGTAISPVIGYAADGFPIYGPCFEDDDGTIRAAQSSFQLRAGTRQEVAGYTTPYVVGNVVSDDYDGQFIGDHEYVDGAGDLDECNGMTVDGQYGYYVTGSYPYVLACYSGTPSTNFR